MNLIKNSLLIIVLIESMILLQILFLDKRVNMNMFKKSVPPNHKTVVTVTIKTPVFTVEEEKRLVQSITKAREELYGFMSKKSDLGFLYSKESDFKMTKAVELYAKKFLGKPYVWGAIGPDKFDCSGFTKKIYSQLGIDIPRYSGHQAEIGTYIKYENLQRGDMVFFDTERKETGRVNHVGIYLEDGNFIHASSGKKKVVITNFNEKIFYKNRFLWGRRVIENKVFKTIPTNSIKYFLNLIV